MIDLEQDHAVHVRFPSSFEVNAVRGARAYGITTLENDFHVVDVFHSNAGP